MPKATHTLLPQDQAGEFQHISVSAINVLARLAARNAVKDQLRADGVRVSLVPVRDIHTTLLFMVVLHTKGLRASELRPCKR